jgi:ribosomal protein S18 acetylase RimI-like enzyme
MHTVTYRATGIGEIELIRPLWDQLNRYHHEKASHFRAHYEQMTFEDRKSHFTRLHESGQLQVDLAQDTRTGHYIGYCVSSVSAEKAGELESLFVDATYRSAGIGTALVTRGLAWMDSLGAVRKRVSVGNGNETAWAFYRKFGFYPRMTVLEQKPERD